MQNIFTGKCCAVKKKTTVNRRLFSSPTFQRHCLIRTERRFAGKVFPALALHISKGEDVWVNTFRDWGLRHVGSNEVRRFQKRKKNGHNGRNVLHFQTRTHARTHAHLPRLPLEQQIKRERTLSPLHRATVANRQLSVATGWPSFYGYGVPSRWTMTAGGGRKKIRRDFSMWASLGLLRAGFITANKRC